MRTVPIGPLGEESLYEYRLRALLRYKDLHGHMRVKQMFHVPWSPKWSQKFWGLWLGDVVSSVRRGKLHEDKHEELKAAGFDFNPQAATPGHKIGWDVVEAALQAYKDQVGDLNGMKTTFVVPRNNRWPKATWGLNIGMILNHIKWGTHYSDKRLELLRMGVQFKALGKRLRARDGRCGSVKATSAVSARPALSAYSTLAARGRKGTTATRQLEVGFVYDRRARLSISRLNPILSLT